MTLLCSGGGCVHPARFLNQSQHELMCWAHAQTLRCVCGTLVEQDFLAGCGAWRPMDLALQLALTSFYSEEGYHESH